MEDHQRLSWAVLLSYGALGLPLAALNLPLYVYLPSFYAGDVGIGLATVGLVLFAARLLDTVTDPLIGEFGDRTRTRFGRRRPWILAAAPLLIISTFMLFVPSEGAGAAYLFIWTGLAYIAWTMMLLPYTAWGAELSQGYHERSKITGAREGFVVVGILLAAGLPVLIGADAEKEPGRVLEAICWTMAIVLPFALLLLFWQVKEEPAKAEQPLSFLKGLQIARRNKPFLRLVAAYFLNGIANGLPATLFLLFVGDALQLEEAAGPLLLLYFLTGIAGIPLWLRLSYRIGKHRAWSIAMIWACVVFASVPFLGPGDFWPFLIVCCLSGFSLGADLALPASIQADVVDLDWLESGRRRTGLFFALWSMTTKFSLALAVGIAFPVLDLIGFEAGGENDATALFGLAALYGLAPVVIKLASIALVWNFPLDADTQAKLREKLGPQELDKEADDGAAATARAGA